LRRHRAHYPNDCSDDVQGGDQRRDDSMGNWNSDAPSQQATIRSTTLGGPPTSPLMATAASFPDQ